MAFDPYEPYGPVIDTTFRLATWNVWGRFGDWPLRQDGIEKALREVSPDIVSLTEAWTSGEESQAELLARQLGYEHYEAGDGWRLEGWTSGFGLASRWPIASVEQRPLGDGDDSSSGSAFYALVEGDRGPIDLFTVMLDYRLDGSAVRLGQLERLGEFVDGIAGRRNPVIVCGDFNVGPDSDEVRALTGRSAPIRPGLVFYDAWEVAGDGSPGHTWSNRNPLAAVGMYPDRRLDYVLSAWPRKGAQGHPVRCGLLGIRDSGQPQLSDHYGVFADLRY